MEISKVAVGGATDDVGYACELYLDKIPFAEVRKHGGVAVMTIWRRPGFPDLVLEPEQFVRAIIEATKRVNSTSE
jgi:hypothetical protein